MPRIFVDFNKLDSVENDIFDVWRRVGEDKRNFNNTIDNLDWEVKSQERILRRSQQAVEKLDKITESLKSYSRFVLNCYEKYDELEHLEVKSDYVKIESATEKENRKKHEQQAYIDDFENKNPDIKKKFDKFLNSGSYNDLSDEEKREIKYRAYTADEPGRTVFLNNLEKLKIRTTNAKGEDEGQSYYKQYRHDITLSRRNDIYDAFDKNPDDRYDYHAVYHESGHAIDDLSDFACWLGKDSTEYKAYSYNAHKSMTIREAVLYDIYDNKNNPYSLINFYNENKTDEMGTFEDFKNSVIAGVKYNYDNKIPGYKYFLYGEDKVTDSLSSISDLYGGATNNAAADYKFTHPIEYWEDDSKIASEAWAEYFEGYFIQDKTYQYNMKKYLPTACEIMDSYAADLAKKAKPINV